MVTDRNEDSRKTTGKQGPERISSEPNKIGASTPYDFNGKNLTPYGGLLPVITMLEKLDFQSLVEQTLTSKRIPRAMDVYRFVLGIVLGLYIGFPRLNQLRFIARDPILTGMLEVTKLPVQSTFWRFVNALHRNVARQMLTIMRTVRERVWAAANVKLEVVTIDTDTTVHTLFGQQMGGAWGFLIFTLIHFPVAHPRRSATGGCGCRRWEGGMAAWGFAREKERQNRDAEAGDFGQINDFDDRIGAGSSRYKSLRSGGWARPRRGSWRRNFLWRRRCR